MKNTFKILGLLAGIFVFLYACKEDELTTYDRENNIFFTNRDYKANTYRATLTWGDDAKEYKSPIVSVKSTQAVDTLKHSMAKSGSYVVIPVRIVGALSSEKREFGYKATAVYKEKKEGDENYDPTALSRTKFEVLDAFIPANKRDGGILVRLIDDEMAETDSFTIKFELTANDNFQLNYSKELHDSQRDSLVSTSEIILQYNKFVQEPPFWKNSATAGYFYVAFGPFSYEKLMIMVNEFGIDTSDNWLYVSSGAYYPAFATVVAYGIMLRDYLAEQAALGNVIMCPVTGKPMTAGVIIPAI